MHRSFVTADVFTDRAFGGNPVAVFPDGRGLPDGRMQQIAREMNLSETVFVLPPDSPAHTRRLRIFTPTVEMPFAGHPTLGTAFVLAALGEIPLGPAGAEIVFEEGVGPIPVRIEARDARPTRTSLAAARVAETGPAPPAAHALAECLGLGADDLLGGDRAPVAASCGIPFLFVALRDRAAVARARLDLVAWERHLAGFWAPSVLLWAEGAEQPAAGLHARMFAPAMGVAEDPATGSAAVAFGCVLAERDPRPEGALRWVVEQGCEMGRPSLLEIEVTKRAGAVVETRVGGGSVLVSRGEMEIPEGG